MAYTPSDKVKKHEEDYYAHLQNKPGEFSSDYTAKANEALNNYMNRGEFKYNPATDSGYQAARKQYTRGGQQAMKDTLGTATELTGGYDNSYAQAAAQQTYNEYMAELANLMPQYEQQAYGRWQDQGNQMLDYYSLMKGEANDAYSKYMDSVNLHNAEADRLYGLYSDAYSRDYGAYQDAVAQDQWERTFAYQKDMDAAAAETARINAETDYLKALAEDEPLFYEYAGEVKGKNAAGSEERTGTKFYKDGKEYTFDLGINPYTSKVNRDVANGARTARNGYQPLQIGVYDNKGNLEEFIDLKKTEYESDENGVWQSIFTTGDGRYWLWNGRLNEYEEVTDPTKR